MLSVPSDLKLTAALNFAHQIATLPDDVGTLILNFEHLGENGPFALPIEPFGIVITAHAIQDLRQRNPSLKIRAVEIPHSEVISYATHMGFFDQCGFEMDKPFGEAKGSPTYLPLTNVGAPASMSHSDIEKLSLSLAMRLTQDEEMTIDTPLAYILREIIRNVKEHSNASSFWYSAQYWKKRNIAEIALVDNGIGLRATLLDNPLIRDRIVDDGEALKYAMMPGISGKMYYGKKRDPDNRWENSGFGLYMIYRICGETGNFFIGTGDTGISHGADKPHEGFKFGLRGVALRVRINIEKLAHYQEFFPRFLADAEIKAAEVMKGQIPATGSMSQMLKVDPTVNKKTDE